MKMNRNIVRIVRLFLVFGLLFSILNHPAELHARGGFTGGGGGRAGGGRAGGGGGGRPSMGGGSISRPSTPSLGSSRPSRPSGGSSRPNFDRPSPSPRPQISSPSGGIKPSTRPANLPTGSLTRPATRPGFSRPDTGGSPGLSRPDLANRPSGLPATGSTRPSIRPSTRPSFPGLNGGGGSNRPSFDFPQTRPGGGDRPVTLPNRPGEGGGRPGMGRPENGLSGLTRPGTTRPGAVGRPSPGQIGDFLDLNRPLLPETRPATRPGNGGVERPGIAMPDRPRPETRPAIPDTLRPGAEDRPGLGNLTRPETRPAPDRRPGIGDRPINNARPINIGDIQFGNNVIHNRPNWVTINDNQFININNKWQNQVGNLHNWHDRHPDRLNYFDRWGNSVRDRWHHHHHNWFGPDWWHQHRHGWCGWHYGYHFNYYNWNYWWRVPTYSSCVNWFTWTAPATVWTQPVYYDYGQGGNVVYQDNSVYVNNTPVATADEFAESAAVLATVPPPASEAEAEAAEWLPLGTFAVTTDVKEVEPTRVMQLAVSKTGIISGTLYNSTTDQAYTIQGQVDKNTQRVAFRIGESQNIVLETGLYNLTQEEAPVLVHYGKERVENWLLVRLENPENSSTTEPTP